MKTYVAHLSNFNLSDGIYYSSKDNYKSINKFSGLKEFENLDHKDTLIVLLPSMLVGSFPFKSNEKLSSKSILQTSYLILTQIFLATYLKMNF
ncbi:MAG: hypothetical protein CM15mP102_21470 [Flavobacteriales bacterium]|nr:MAG: hypothetical protein CM15mP102_21470 [Flavobacteriales bacterium]